MPDDLFEIDWICREAAAAKFTDAIAADGGSVRGTAPFTPSPEEVDLFADPQFDPLLAITVMLGLPLCLRMLRRAVADLRGERGTALVLDLSGERPEARHVPLGDARLVIVKGRDGQQVFDPENIGGIESAFTELARNFIGRRAG
jgi:hypothetical protein